MTLKAQKFQKEKKERKKSLTYFEEKFWENILTYFQKFSAKIFRFWSNRQKKKKKKEKSAKTENLGRSRL